MLHGVTYKSKNVHLMSYFCLKIYIFLKMRFFFSCTLSNLNFISTYIQYTKLSSLVPVYSLRDCNSNNPAHHLRQRQKHCVLQCLL